MSPAVVVLDALRQLTERVLNALVGKRLVALNQVSRADHIGVQDDRELADRLLSQDTPSDATLGVTIRDTIVSG